MSDEVIGEVISFRRLEASDLPLLHAWLNEPGTARWWAPSSDLSFDGVVEEHTKSIRGEEPVDEYIALEHERPIGWIQTYAVDDHDEYATAIAAARVPTSGLAGIDYLLGDPADRGRGLGVRMIQAFLADVVFGQHPGWERACAGPDPANTRSIRVLEKAGFRFAADIVTEDGPEHLMVIDPTLVAP